MKKNDLIYDGFKKYEINKPFSKTFNKWLENYGESYSHKFKFDNNYGATVIKCFGSYGYEEDLFELAVIKYDDEKDTFGNICNSTSITDDILGYLTNNEVLKFLEAIKNLKPYNFEGIR